MNITSVANLADPLGPSQIDIASGTKSEDPSQDSATATMTAADVNACLPSPDEISTFNPLVIVSFLFEITRVRGAFDHTGHRPFVLLDHPKFFMRADEA
ncbi:hypothetical protein Pla52o_34440 [Novipirellula galeiformis]|uniref:Uncharacterized protein n=1 Tax=Novipirellula galeiformis TaxID=2528004 RepID=A0A5C6CDQ1_9BACT|nr:hypothetical protein Pla52o_34440 [Novipirellula galeiformis]